jgi:GH24 family phage-related lysozyme (muramidase)
MAPPSVHGALGQPGQALDRATRAFFEPRFGVDLQTVRVHTEQVAAEAARAVGAHAFTVGERIVFARGAFAPSSDAGRRLLAHELAHVVQQRGRLAAGRLQREDAPKASKVPDKICDPPTGNPKQPSEVSPKLLDRMMGKVAGDPGEGCRSQPYPASNGEKVCTYGYGHQIKDCPIINKKSGARPTKAEVDEANTVKPRDADNPYDEDKARALRPDEWLICQCAGKTSIGCPDQAAALLKTDANSTAVPYVRKNVPVDLTEAQFDAFADLTLHRGSIGPYLLEAVKRYWCTAEGRNYVRDIYLGTDLSPQGSSKPLSAFMDRRQNRVWPVE